MLRELYDTVLAHKTALYCVSGISVLMFVGSLLLVPVVIARAPKNYFVSEPERRTGGLGWLRWCALNLFGLALLLIGLALLVLPGQGILLVLLALSLMNFPGKHRLIQRIAKRPKVWRGLNYFRRRAQKEPFDPI